MKPKPITSYVPKATGGIQIIRGWRNSPTGRHALFVLAHLLFVLLAIAYVLAARAVVA